MKYIYVSLLFMLVSSGFISASEVKLLENINFNIEIDGAKTELYTIRNRNGCVAQFTNYGGRWLSMWVSDKNGIMRDVILGFDDIDSYLDAEEPYHGAITGRVCGRIAKGIFELDGHKYKLANNDGFGNPIKNHLHGGVVGFHKKLWLVTQSINDFKDEYIEFSYLSMAGEEGYPGNLGVKVRYTLTQNNSMNIEYFATTDEPTIVNLTNHAYFNLTGIPSISVDDHYVQINADRYIACDKELTPTGELPSLKGSYIDFRKPTLIGDHIDKTHPEIFKNRGYAIAYALNITDNPIWFAAMLYAPYSGIAVDVYTNQPSLQFYNAWLMTGNDIGKNTTPYYMGAGVVLETQGYPDAPNHANFPSIKVTPTSPYYHVVEYRFKIKNN